MCRKVEDEGQIAGNSTAKEAFDKLVKPLEEMTDGVEGKSALTVIAMRQTQYRTKNNARLSLHLKESKLAKRTALNQGSVLVPHNRLL